MMGRNWKDRRQAARNEMTLAARRFARQGEEAIERALGGLSVALPLPPLNNSEDEMMTDGLHAGERWQCFSSFRLGQDWIGRGDFLSDEQTAALRASPNYIALRDSYLRPGTPPPDWRPRNRAVAAPRLKPMDVEPLEWVVELAGRAVPGSRCWRLAEVIASTGLPLSVAMDLITARRVEAPHDIIGKATTEYAALPKVLSNGQRSGQGHWMRSVEGFLPYVGCLVAQLRKLKEAA